MPIEKLLMPFLHIKLGIVKNVTKAVVTNKIDPEHAQNVLMFLKDEVFNEKITLPKLKGGMLEYLNVLLYSFDVNAQIKPICSFSATSN